MNRTAPKLKKRSSPSPTTKDSHKKPAPSPRNPLKDLNSIAKIRSTTHSRYTTSISSNSSSSSSLSNEAPKGCLGFFLPNSSSKNAPKSFNRTPKSAPVSKLRSKPPISQKTKSTQFLSKSDNTKDCIFKEIQPSPQPKLKEFGSGTLQWPFSRTSVDDSGEDFTPLVKKLGCGGDLDEKERTPPVEVSISPEIQCGSSSFTANASACYGAGHVLSGVTDKRKCRPRGILAVGEELGFCEDGLSVDDDRFLGFFNNAARLSIVPAPIEALMHWLSPSCEEENDQKGSPQNGSTPFPSPSSASTYGNGFSSDMHGNTDNSAGHMINATRRKACLVTPSAPLDFEGLLETEYVTPDEERRYRFSSTMHISPSTGGDSLGSYNAVCTPQSDSSLDCVVGLPWFKNEKGCMVEFDSMSDVHSTPSLSPKNQTSMCDPANVLTLPGFSFQFMHPTRPSSDFMSNVHSKPCLSPENQTSMCDPADVLPLPGFSFQFTHPNRPLSDFIDQAQLEKASNDWRLGISSASCGNFLQSPMTISWRDGLVSRIFEMDDLDCCRVLSDEEEDISCNIDDKVVQGPMFSDNVMLHEVVSKQPETEAHEKSDSYAESFSTEGLELIASSDSDWNLCYKNQLFKE